MRKTILHLILIFLALSGINAGYHHELTKPFTIQAGYDDIASISVTPIAAQAQTYLAGMPFDIESSQVWYGETEYGRQIATWNLLSNASFDLVVTAKPLRAVDDNNAIKQDSAPLNYTLRFQYVFGYTTETGTKASIEGMISCSSSATDNTTVFENIAPEYGQNSGSTNYIGGVEGSIYFMFDENSTALIKDNLENSASTDVPAGRYLAQVTLKLEATE